MADLVIRGMEMPTSCGLCPMFCDDFNDYCSAAQRPIPFDAEKPDWCPLVPLPEGHGRLIDADAIRKEIDANRPGRIYEDAWALTVMDHAPTIVPAEGGSVDGN